MRNAAIEPPPSQRNLSGQMRCSLSKIAQRCCHRSSPAADGSLSARISNRAQGAKQLVRGRGPTFSRRSLEVKLRVRLLAQSRRDLIGSMRVSEPGPGESVCYEIRTRVTNSETTSKTPRIQGINWVNARAPKAVQFCTDRI